MGMLSCRGDLHPPRGVVILWGTLMGASASVLLLAGGLEALQQAAILAAAPFLIVMIGLAVSLVKALRADTAAVAVVDARAGRGRRRRRQRRPTGVAARSG